MRDCKHYINKGCELGAFRCHRNCDFYHPKNGLKATAIFAYKDGRHWNRGGGLNR